MVSTGIGAVLSVSRMATAIRKNRGGYVRIDVLATPVTGTAGDEGRTTW
jgi:hypothetical protein